MIVTVTYLFKSHCSVIQGSSCSCQVVVADIQLISYCVVLIEQTNVYYGSKMGSEKRIIAAS